jgi:hypothetical protein
MKKRTGNGFVNPGLECAGVTGRSENCKDGVMTGMTWTMTRSESCRGGVVTGQHPLQRTGTIASFI